MSIARKTGRALLVAFILAIAALLMTAATGVVGAQPALADDGDDGGEDDGRRGDDDGGRDDDDGGRGDDDGRGGDDDADDRGVAAAGQADDDADDDDDRGAAKGRGVPVGGVQTGAGGTAPDANSTPWLLGGAGLLLGGGLIASRLRSVFSGTDA
jgi:hypothetical protein